MKYTITILFNLLFINVLLSQQIDSLSIPEQICFGENNKIEIFISGTHNSNNYQIKWFPDTLFVNNNNRIVEINSFNKNITVNAGVNILNGNDSIISQSLFSLNFKKKPTDILELNKDNILYGELLILTVKRRLIHDISSCFIDYGDGNSNIWSLDSINNNIYYNYNVNVDKTFNYYYILTNKFGCVSGTIKKQISTKKDTNACVEETTPVERQIQPTNVNNYVNSLFIDNNDNVFFTTDMATEHKIHLEVNNSIVITPINKKKNGQTYFINNEYKIIRDSSCIINNYGRKTRFEGENILKHTSHNNHLALLTQIDNTIIFSIYKIGGRIRKISDNTDINNFCFQNKDTLWLATDNGISIFDVNSNFINPFKIKSNQNDYYNLKNFKITGIAIKDSLLYFTGLDKAGGNSCLWKYNIKKNKLTELYNKKYTPYVDSEEQTLYIDSENNLWIGGYNLIKYDTNQDWTIYEKKEITFIAEDSNKRLWLGTKSGLKFINDITTQKLKPIGGLFFEGSGSGIEYCFNDQPILYENDYYLRAGYIKKAYFDFGDGTIQDTLKFRADGIGFSDTIITYKYDNCGTYDVKLYVESNHGCSDTSVVKVAINPNPIIKISIDSLCQNEPLTIIDSSYIECGDSIVSKRLEVFNKKDERIYNKAIDTNIILLNTKKIKEEKILKLKFTYKSSTGCDSILDTIIVRKDIPWVTIDTIGNNCFKQPNKFEANLLTDSICSLVWRFNYLDSTTNWLNEYTDTIDIPNCSENTNIIKRIFRINKKKISYEYTPILPDTLYSNNLISVNSLGCKAYRTFTLKTKPQYQISYKREKCECFPTTYQFSFDREKIISDFLSNNNYTKDTTEIIQKTIGKINRVELFFIEDGDTIKEIEYEKIDSLFNIEYSFTYKDDGSDYEYFFVTHFEEGCSDRTTPETLKLTKIPNNIVFIIDVSGSFGWNEKRRLKNTMSAWLAFMDKDDRISVYANLNEEDYEDCVFIEDADYQDRNDILKFKKIKKIQFGFPEYTIEYFYNEEQANLHIPNSNNRMLLITDEIAYPNHFYTFDTDSFKIFYHNKDTSNIEKIVISQQWDLSEDIKIDTDSISLTDINKFPYIKSNAYKFHYDFYQYIPDTTSTIDKIVFYKDSIQNSLSIYKPGILLRSKQLQDAGWHVSLLDYKRKKLKEEDSKVLFAEKYGCGGYYKIGKDNATIFKKEFGHKQIELQQWSLIAGLLIPKGNIIKFNPFDYEITQDDKEQKTWVNLIYSSRLGVSYTWNNNFDNLLSVGVTFTSMAFSTTLDILNFNNYVEIPENYRPVGNDGQAYTSIIEAVNINEEIIFKTVSFTPLFIYEGNLYSLFLSNNFRYYFEIGPNITLLYNSKVNSTGEYTFKGGYEDPNYGEIVKPLHSIERYGFVNNEIISGIGKNTEYFSFNPLDLPLYINTGVKIGNFKNEHPKYTFRFGIYYYRISGYNYNNINSEYLLFKVRPIKETEYNSIIKGLSIKYLSSFGCFVDCNIIIRKKNQKKPKKR